MRSRYVLLCLAILLPCAARAGPKENALHHFAQAIASANICPRIQVNEPMMAAAIIFHGIDLKASEQALQADVREQMRAFEGKDPEWACMAGWLYYGPSGMNVPGLVIEK